MNEAEDIITVLLLRVKELLQETNKMREALEAMIAVRPLGKHINPPCDCELCKATRLGKAALEAGKVDE